MKQAQMQANGNFFLFPNRQTLGKAVGGMGVSAEFSVIQVIPRSNPSLLKKNPSFSAQVKVEAIQYNNKNNTKAFIIHNNF